MNRELSKMPKLIIDDREIEVPKGTKVIEAAERLGIMIPRFCYHEALGSVGACRMCAVKFLEGPRKGIDMSCMVEAKDGADLAGLLHEGAESAGLFYLLPGPNAFGAGLLSPTQDQESVLKTIESGKVDALILVEQDTFWFYPDSQRLDQALNKLSFLLVLDYLPSPSAKRAHGVLPTTPHFERTSGSFVNQEGRLQKALPIHRGGTPISQISGGHPPPGHSWTISPAETQRRPMRYWPNSMPPYQVKRKGRF